MRSDYSFYTPEYISGTMSLRKPQQRSLEILDDLFQSVSFRKNMNLKAACAAIHALYPTFTDFEREFPSLAFALATGVGKTRLMGSFIAYLYTQHEIRNFFIVAPNTTIYDKLKSDFSDPNSEKYVFTGLGCFSSPPQIITEQDYRSSTINYFTSEIRIFIYNIDKFNKENAAMRRDNEYLGTSFFSYAAGLDDLVLIMDESHHYRAERGSQSLNELNPMLGIELTATPYTTSSKGQVLFQNVVYEYPLSEAIADGYTRTPYAMTRSDINFYKFGDDALDILMLQDGLLAHETTKEALAAYADSHPGIKRVKPFMLVVCKDTDHAKTIEEYIRSDRFGDGHYKDKTIIVHSKLKSAESDANLKLLLDVEKPENEVEIVIHVNMLKEGWDVNNLYTIVPLRTAASKVLREQMVGRGLRLPFGARTGIDELDRVVLTAHDKFDDILREAAKGDSIFKAGCVIKAEDLEKTKSVTAQLKIPFPAPEEMQADLKEVELPDTEAGAAVLQAAIAAAANQVNKHLKKQRTHKPLTPEQKQEIAKVAAEAAAAEAAATPNNDLGDEFEVNRIPLAAWLTDKVAEIEHQIVKKYIPIPKIAITDPGEEEYRFVDFEPDMAPFNHKPISNDILLQNLTDLSLRESVTGNYIDFEGYQPERVLVKLLREKPEIDYERCSGLLFKLITSICNHYREQFGQDGLSNIVMMFRKDIANQIYGQMMKHFFVSSGSMQEEVVDVSPTNISPYYNYETQVGLFDAYTGSIRSILFSNIEYGVFPVAKFDSLPELTFARVLERDAKAGKVTNWLRPADQEFNISYNHGRHYRPDFVVETSEFCYLVEIKGSHMLNDPDVIAKKERAVRYCEVASAWCRENGYREWRHLFIPDNQISEGSTFAQLAVSCLVL